MFIFFVLAIIFVVWLRFKMKKGSKSYNFKENLNELIEREKNANFARRREVEEKFFVSPNLDTLPIDKYPLKDVLISAANKKMLRFDKVMSNIELKERYGLANLDFIIAYEENLQRFIRELNNCGQFFIDNEMFDNARAVLEEAVALGSEISKSYFLLSDIYFSNRDETSLKQLLDKVSGLGFENNPGFKLKVLAELEGKLSRL